MIPFLFLLVLTLTMAYSPDTGDNWLDLKPQGIAPVGAFSSVPFSFGLVVAKTKAAQGQSVTEGEMTNSESTLDSDMESDMESALANPKRDPSSDLADLVELAELADSANLDNLGSTADLPASENQEQETAQSLANSNVDAGNTDEADRANGASAQNSFVTEAAETADAVNKKSALESDHQPYIPVSCINESVLQLSLQDGVLRSTEGRVGSIVSNRQFQFDGPVPQHGSIYAAGWLITPQGQLSLGSQTTFYQCASGEFYKLYDSSIGGQCSPVVLEVVELIQC